MRLRTRFLVAMLAVIAVGETVAVVTFYNQQKQHDITEQMVSLGNQMHHIADFQVGVVQLALQTSPVTRPDVESLQSLLRTSRADWLQMSPAAIKPHVRLLGPRVGALVSTRLHFDRLPQGDSALRREYSQVLVAEVRQIVGITKQVHGAVDVHILAAQRNARAEQNDAFHAVLIGSAVSLAAAVGLALLLAQAISRPMARLAAGARELATGRLDYRLDEGSNDEIGVVATEFNRMADQLQDAHATMEERVKTRTRELAEANRELDLNRAEQERLAQQRRMLLKRVISAQEAERQRIARELHDETGQSLAALGLGLEAALGELRSGQQQSLASRLQSLGHLASDSIDELNRLVLDLRPAQLDHLGLVATLRWYATRVQPHVQTELDVKGTSVRLEPEVETALFRIAQEAMTNVARHANASEVQIVLTFGDDLVSLEVKDDGVGFDSGASPPASSLGLIGMRERAQLIGGVLAVHSQPGKGTQVSVTVPVEGDDRGEWSEARPLVSEAMGAEIRRRDTEPNADDIAVREKDR